MKIDETAPFPMLMHLEVVLSCFPKYLENLFIPGLIHWSPNPANTAIGATSFPSSLSILNEREMETQRVSL